MKKTPLLYCSLFIVFLLLMDLLIGIVSSRLTMKQTTGVSGMIIKTINDTSSVLILGSSRAANHYDSKVIENKVKKTTFNAGSGGQGIFYNYAVLDERLRKHKPKIVVLDVAPNIMMDLKQYDKLTALYPLVDKFDAFASIVRLNPDFKPVLMYSNAYRYNSTAFQFFYEFVSPINMYDAYVGIDGHISERTIIESKENNVVEISKKEIKLLLQQLKFIDKINKLCESNKIPFIVLISPSYFENNTISTAKEKIIGHLQSKSIMCKDYSLDIDFYGKQELFKDILHLNREGARFYSEKVARMLLQQKKLEEEEPSKKREEPSGNKSHDNR